MFDSIKIGDAIFHTGATLRWYRDPVRVIKTAHVNEVRACLDAVSAEVTRGRTAVGFVAYEAAPAFDPALMVHPASPEPLCWFGLYDAAAIVPVAEVRRRGTDMGTWSALLDEHAYVDRAESIRQWIRAGDTYQVNYTFPLRASFAGDPLSWFIDRATLQRGDYSTLIHLGDRTIVSVSPELFFHVEGGTITMRPMKGTWHRGLWPDDDEACAAALAASEKDRAENVMIVDMVRNDLGRIARTGSVVTERLFTVERYPTVWQMTSTVSARTVRHIPDIFAALFPSASVTGAPKVRTMQLIREVEPEPRGIYCGAIGEWTREHATFSVAIRSAVVEHTSSTVRYAVGSGLTWESDPRSEYHECLLKAEVVRSRPQPFELLETIRWDGGLHLLDEHLARLRGSAAFFDIPLDLTKVRGVLDTIMTETPETPCRIRLLVRLDGTVHAESHPMPSSSTLTVCLDREPTLSTWRYLYHKTTLRTVYEAARKRHPGADDVILWNERGELTESTLANLVVRLDGVWYTPPIQCGLLPGTFRARLLNDGALHERVLTPGDLHAAESVQLINSVRGWIDVELMEASEVQDARRD